MSGGEQYLHQVGNDTHARWGTIPMSGGESHSRQVRNDTHVRWEADGG